MGTRVDLLNSEIQHLAEMIQIISYEMTILHDFMKETFGSQFHFFRENHPLQEAMTAISKPQQTEEAKVTLTARKSTSQIKRYRQSETSNPRPGGHLSSETNHRLQLNMDEASQDVEEAGQHNDLFGGGGGDCEAYERDSLLEEEGENYGGDISFWEPSGEESSSTGKSRPKQAIWDKFIVKRLPNKRTQAQCPRCQHIWIFAKVERLEAHLRSNCGLVVNRKIRAEKPPKPSRISGMEVVEYSVQNSSIGENVQESSLVQDISHEKTDQSLVVYTHKGRELDPVWKYFNVSYVEEKKVATCKKCEKKVSCKVERVRAHFIACKGLDNEEDIGK